VKQSRGHVKIYSEIGEGTTVKIYLPRFHAGPEKDVEEAPQSVVRGAKNETILVVEDDLDVRTYSIESLRELGYNVLEASNATAALQLLASHPDVAVLFTDIGLPGGMNGRQLADECRKRLPSLKVLFTTGYARNAIVHDGRLDAGVELLTKPFTHGALAEKLRDILDAKSTPARVLIVEDEVMIQMLAVDYLQEAGLKADTASSGTEALNKLKLIPGGVDAVIIDMGLPDRTGDSLVREVRSLHPSLPIVIASGRSMEEISELLRAMPAIAFVRKPYTEDGLRAALTKLGIRC
jgi:CheY-like chemotaxis protein